MSNTTKYQVFVYGTLKRGGHNHFLLQATKGYPATAPQIDLYAGPHYPYAVRGRGQAVGEVYEVNEAILKTLDDLEGHPHNYHRELTSVNFIGGKAVKAWIYLNNKAYHYPRIDNGDWPSSVVPD